MKSKFELGQMIMTRGIAMRMEESEQFKNEVYQAFSQRYVLGDWGEMCDEDKQMNEDALTNGDRIVAAYQLTYGKIYIITEYNRTYTTIMMANEY